MSDLGTTAGWPAGADAAAAPARPFSAPLPVTVVDALMLLASVLVTRGGAGAVDIDGVPFVWLLVFALLAMVLLRARVVHRLRLGSNILDDVRAVLVAPLLAAVGTVFVRVIVAEDVDGLRGQTLLATLVAVVFLTTGRVLLDRSRRRTREHAITSPTLVVGAGHVGRLVARRLLASPELGLQPVGFVDDDPGDEPPTSLPVVGGNRDLLDAVERHAIGHVVVAFSRAPDAALLEALRRCEERGVIVSVVPRLFERMTKRTRVEHLGGLPLLLDHRPDPGGLAFAVKYAFDRLLAALLLLALLPVLLLITAGVLLSDGRPVVFRQRRVGLDGRVFDILKFRTMNADGAAAFEVPPPDVAPGDDRDRLTRFGAFLRRRSLDEIPQLLNVVRGEMSLVGPRPERPEYVSLFAPDVHRYHERHRVKAGITGWAQVNGLRGGTSLSDRVEWDNHYIENWSLWFDVKILLMTVAGVVRPPRRAV